MTNIQNEMTTLNLWIIHTVSWRFMEVWLKKIKNHFKYIPVLSKTILKSWEGNS